MGRRDKWNEEVGGEGKPIYVLRKMERWAF